jgi:hypothetical protein
VQVCTTLLGHLRPSSLHLYEANYDLPQGDIMSALEGGGGGPSQKHNIPIKSSTDTNKFIMNFDGMTQNPMLDGSNSETTPQAPWEEFDPDKSKKNTHMHCQDKR